MLNTLWVVIVLLSIVFSVVNDRMNDVANAIMTSATQGFNIALGLAGILVFWLGLFRVAEAAGLIETLARALRRPMGWLFPDVPSDHPAMGAMIMNLSANLLGLNHAATPLGIKAMRYLSELNHGSPIASNAMCLFLAINTSSVTIIPATTMAFLAQAGAHNPSDIILTSLLATICSTVAGVAAAKFLQGRPRFAVKAKTEC